MKKALLPGQPDQLGSIPNQAGLIGTHQFGPGQNLIGTQIGPGTSQGQQTTNQAAQTVGGAQLRDPSQPLLNLAQQNIGQAQVGQVGGFGQDVGQARQTTGQLLGSLANAPSRQDLALQSYDALANADLANRGAAIRGLGQRAAALGRIGSGMVTSEAGDIFRQGEANLANTRAQLSAGAAGGTMQDQLARLGAAQGVTQGLGGLDLAQNQLGFQGQLAGANLALGRAGAYQGLGGQQFGQNQAMADFLLRKGGQQAGIGQQQFGQELTGREELRGERGYQQGMDQTAQDRAIQQRMLEDQLVNSQFGRDQSRNQLLAQTGFQGIDPLQTYIAGQYGQQGQESQDALAAMLGQVGQRQGGNYSPELRDALYGGPAATSRPRPRLRPEVRDIS